MAVLTAAPATFPTTDKIYGTFTPVYITSSGAATPRPETGQLFPRGKL